MRIKADVSTIDILDHILLWFLLIRVTFGMAAFFYPYSFSKFVINRSVLIDKQGSTRKMTCNTDLLGKIGHVILWAIISILTLGLGYAFYFYKVWNYSLNNTTTISN